MKRAKNLILICLLFSLNAFGQAPSFGFGNKVEGRGVFDVAIDDDGNMYTTGWYRQTVDFDPGPNVFNVTESGYQDNYILKLDALGNFVWVKSITNPSSSGGGYVSCTSLTTDDKGDLFLSGKFYGTVDFDPDTGVVNMTSVSGKAEGFILKLSKQGDFVWIKQLAGDLVDIQDIIIGANADIYLTGGFQGTVDFNPGSGVANKSVATWGSSNSQDVFILKLDSLGGFSWVKSMGNYFYDAGFSIDETSNGDIVITGVCNNTIDINPNSGVYNLQAGINDIWILKLSSTGSFLWGKLIAGSNDDYVAGLTIDNINNIYLIGTFKYTVDFDPGSAVYNLTAAGSSGDRDIFVLKLNSAGNFSWANRIGNSNTEYASDIEVDMNGNVYSLGRFFGTVDFDPDTGTTNLAGAAEIAFIQKMSTTGQFQWAEKLGGNKSVYSGGLAVSKYGNVYNTGGFRGSFDLDPTNGTYNVSNSNGSSRVYNLKWNNCMSYTVHDTLRACSPFIWSDGSYYDKDTVITETLLTHKQCDSTVITNVSFENLDTSVVQIASGFKSLAKNVSYQWIDCQTGIFIAGETDSIFMPIQNGTYAVIVTSVMCSDTSRCISMNNIGINKNVWSNFKFYPNPTQGNLVLNGPIDEISEINIYDLRGRLISQFLPLQNSNFIKLRIESPSGVYIVELVSKEQKRKRFKVIKTQ